MCSLYILIIYYTTFYYFVLVCQSAVELHCTFLTYRDSELFYDFSYFICLPTCLLTCLLYLYPTYHLPAYLPYVPAYSTYTLPTYLPTYPTYLPTYVPTYPSLTSSFHMLSCITLFYLPVTHRPSLLHLYLTTTCRTLLV